MTTLIVRPIRLNEPGSYRERKRFLRLLKKLRDLSDSQDAGAVLTTLEEADELLTARLRTDDGTPVEDVLDRLSAQEFDNLLTAVAFESGVGEGTGGASDSGPRATVESTPTG